MLNTCRLCGHDKFNLYFTEGVDQEFKYYMCRNCLLVNYDMSAGFDQEKHTLELIDARVKKNKGSYATYRFIKRYAPEPGRILDIGCSNGALLLLAKEDGWQVRGIELFEQLANHVKQTTGIEVVVCDFLNYKVGEGEQYDIVVLRHVLEHLHDPVHALKTINTMLKKDGLAFLEFPNIRSINLRAKYFLRRHGLAKWKQKDYVPHHANEFCKYSFNYLLSKTGFQLEKWSTYSSKQYLSPLYGLFNFGTKARVVIRKIEEVS